MNRIWLLTAALTAVGCGGPQRAAAPVGTAWYEVRFRAAALPAVRANGGPWHLGGRDNSPSLLGGLIGLAVGYPELGFALGSSMVADPEPEAPAPYVVVKIDGLTYSISPIGQTLAPSWSQPIAIPVGRHRGDAEALVQVLDAVDDGVLGQLRLRVDDLVRPGARTLTNVGDVASLDLEVRKASGRPMVGVDLYVDARMSLDDLMGGKSTRWTAVPVWNGDRVTVTATGKACPSGPDECFDPNGAEPGRWASYKYPGFADAPHIALVAALPDQTLVVGRGKTFTVDRAGFLLLFVNDTDEGNNEGGFQVRVEVRPP
ncbi:MAG: hypothetical protein IPL61_13255 [Myxococcales bacterium]|nr:hypothetical protein [Myxococcales bacterium]